MAVMSRSKRYSAPLCLMLNISLIFVLHFSSMAIAEDKTDLVNDSQSAVQIRAWIEPNNELVVKQQVILYIEVSTPDQFLGGTKIAAFDMNEVVILRREKFPVNTTRRIGNKTRSVQLWSITLYPQRQGPFLIPSIELRVPTTNELGQISEVFVTTEPISFIATIPAEIEAQLAGLSRTLNSWIASPHFQVEEHYDKPLNDLKVGSSVTRVIDIQSENIAAMMLPALQFLSPEGLAVYPEPPKIIDKVNRGDYLATRVETVTYVVEKAGSYRLPPLNFYWWNLNLQALQHETLPEQIISTMASTDAINSGVNGGNRLAQPDASSEGLGSSFKIVFILVAVLFAAAFWWFKIAKRGGATDQNTQQLRLERRYQECCRQGDFTQAAAVFFEWFDVQLETYRHIVTEPSLRRLLDIESSPQVLKMFDDLMTAAHSRGSGDRDSHAGKARLNKRSMESLMSEVKRVLLASERAARSGDLPELQLN